MEECCAWTRRRRLFSAHITPLISEASFFNVDLLKIGAGPRHSLHFGLRNSTSQGRRVACFFINNKSQDSLHDLIFFSESMIAVRFWFSVFCYEKSWEKCALCWNFNGFGKIHDDLQRFQIWKFLPRPRISIISPRPSFLGFSKISCGSPKDLTFASLEQKTEKKLLESSISYSLHNIWRIELWNRAGGY